MIAAATAGTAETARLVPASISVDGEIVLRASTSDDGRPDADAVWSYLHRLEFEPTDAFASLGLAPGDTAAELGWLRSRANAAKGEPPELVVSIAYGGRDAPYHLALERSRGSSTWRVAKETIEQRFPHRTITRAQAARLTNPERTR